MQIDYDADRSDILTAFSCTCIPRLRSYLYSLSTDFTSWSLATCAIIGQKHCVDCLKCHSQFLGFQVGVLFGQNPTDHSTEQGTLPILFG